MEQLFDFQGHRMSLGLLQSSGHIILSPNPSPSPSPNPSSCSGEYSLNPNAVEFVPSYRMTAHYPVGPEIVPTETKTEATSTTTLVHPVEIVGDTVDQVENGFYVQRQIFEILSQLGDEQMPLEKVAVGLLPGGQGLSMRFTPKQGQATLVSSLEPNDAMFRESHSLHLDVGDHQGENSLANRPESVLVAQFLIRVNDLLNEKYEYGGDNSVCPKCALCSNRSYTELEIEQQIEGIKAFESFFNFTETTRYQDLVSHKAFKELCHRLGLIVSRDQIHINRSNDGGMANTNATSDMVNPNTTSNSTTNGMPPAPMPSAQPSVITIGNISITTSGVETEMEMETDVEAYAGDDESQSNGEEVTPRGSGSHNSHNLEFVRGKLYRYENSEGSQLVNQLTEGDTDKVDSTMDMETDAPPTTPAKSLTTTSATKTFPRLYKSAKAKCSARGSGQSSLQSGGSTARRTIAHNRSVVSSALTSGSTGAQRGRPPVSGSHNSTTGAVRKHQPEATSCPPGAARKTHHQRMPPATALAFQQDETMAAAVSGRLSKSGRAGTSVQKQTSSHLKTSKGTGGSRLGVTSSKQTHGTSQRMVPRSTTTSLMRQTEVKRRMNLMRGDSDSDLLFNDYLFK
ncbi:uncharacterized protein [Drosophila bipectinata]|uniref:uncharacterized protein n=1 Tax=Drosophila bipectinata TaxID=42026 RepID=UPI001C8ABCA1|nr:uncharacterized protein LOC108126842 [Drosophila bipectinata]